MCPLYYNETFSAAAQGTHTSTMTTTLLVGSTPDALAKELIRRIAAIARDSVEARGVFNIAVSGGSMPKVYGRITQKLT